MGWPEDRRRQLEKRVVEALYSPDPRDADGLDVTVFGDVDDQPIDYFLYADVANELVKAARYRDGRSTAVLTGYFRMNEAGPFIEIVAFRELRYLYGEDLVERARPGLEDVLSDLEADETPGDSPHVVGGFVGWPGGEARLDDEIARLHLSLFNLPYQVAVVVDGEDDRLGMYARKPKEAFFNAGFHLVESAARDDEADKATTPTRSGRSDRKGTVDQVTDDEME